MNARRIAKYRITRCHRWTKRHKKPLIVIGDIVLLILIVWQLWPVSDSEIRRNQVDMEIESYYEVLADGRPVFYFAELDDSMNIRGGAVRADSIVTHKMQAPGFWVNRISFIPSCYGRIMTFAAPKPDDIVKLDNDKLHRFLFRQSVVSDNRLAGLQRMKNELIYYVRRHDIADYGFTQVAKYSALVNRQVDSLQHVVDTLQGISRKAKLSIRFITRYRAVRMSESGDSLNIRCGLSKTYNGQFSLVQTASHSTPISINSRLSITRGMEQVLKAASPKDSKNANPAAVAGKAVSASSADSLKGKTVTLYIDSVGTYVGEVAQDTSRTGVGVPLAGKAHQVRIVPNGIGKMYYNDGAYYEGYWKNGKRNDFGFFVSPSDYLQAGTWKNDVFKGERLTYNANRIYGIDLSRHQHEHDGKKYVIDWSDLRITDLGSETKKEVSGKVDYPISFCYIKSTEGCTVMNPYFNSDYEMARKKGIRVGAYHFFSTTSPGYKQAWEFLKKTKIQKGDLAPVLDVEPNDWQVKTMGGAEVLLNNVRQWLSIVYKQTGQRPIVYVGQTFAHKYLMQATDITGNYLVWIARYGEYKPSLKLAIWQLSSDGRVKGIHGNVDINVFIGYKPEYEEFIKNHTI